MFPCIYYRTHVDPDQKEKDNKKASKTVRKLLLGLFYLEYFGVFLWDENGLLAQPIHCDKIIMK